MKLPGVLTPQYVLPAACAKWGRGDSEMLIEIRELQVHPVDFDEHLAPGTIDFGADFRQEGSLDSKGRAQLVQEHHGKHKLVNDIRIVGDFSTRIELPCAR